MMSVTSSMCATGSRGPSTGANRLERGPGGGGWGGARGEEEQKSARRYAAAPAGGGEPVQGVPYRSQRRQSERSHDVVEAAGRVQAFLIHQPHEFRATDRGDQECADALA